MSYVANQYNHATPLSSVIGFNSKSPSVEDAKYFALFNNTLNGSYRAIADSVGLWGSSLSDANGVLAEPFIVTVQENTPIGAIELLSSQYSYPVAFSIDFYLNDSLVHSARETNNTRVSYRYDLPRGMSADKYIVTITKISAANSVAMVHKILNTARVYATDTLVLGCNESCMANTTRILRSQDILRITARVDDPKQHVTVTADVKDEAAMLAIETPNLINVHALMKRPSRRIYGRVHVTYADPMLDSATNFTASSTAYNSNPSQLIDGVVNPSLTNRFTLYDNDLSGKYVVSGERSQVGWTSGTLSGENGVFNTPQTLRVEFATRPITPASIHFDSTRQCVPADFSVDFVLESGETIRKVFTNNTAASVLVNDDTIHNVVAIVVTITRASRAGIPVTVLELPFLSTIQYEGTDEFSKLISIDMLEELTYDDTVEVLGGVSANETTVVFDNSDAEFYFNNTMSAVSKQLRRNRKIVPELGVEIIPGEIEWYALGTYWSYNWNVPVGGLTASVTGFDTIGLLDTTSFRNHTVLVDKSIGELIDYILSDARKSLSFLEWNVDVGLYDVRIPYAWFEAASHTAALRKLSLAYPMHIYCDRRGRICAAPQRPNSTFSALRTVRQDRVCDAWADSDTVISKEYSSLYTALPNVIRVEVRQPQLIRDEQLVNDELVFNVSAVPTRTLNFSKPYMSDLVVTMDKDASVSYEYTVYSWGISFAFTGQGNVRSITCTGTCVDISNVSTLERRDEMNALLNGEITRDVSADFIQTSEHAAHIIDRIFELSTNDIYDVNVQYRGDIALSINDSILLVDGIAPDNKYSIRRHQLSWNGALTGNADLNT